MTSLPTPTTQVCDSKLIAFYLFAIYVDIFLDCTQENQLHVGRAKETYRNQNLGKSTPSDFLTVRTKRYTIALF